MHRGAAHRGRFALPGLISRLGDAVSASDGPALAPAWRASIARAAAWHTNKERGMRRRQLKTYWKRLDELQKQAPPRDTLLKKLGAAQDRAGRIAVSVVKVEVTEAGALRYQLDREKLRAVRRREGRHLLRTNMTADDPALIWRCYMQLCHVEEAFRTLKGDLGLRPIFHPTHERIEAHMFVAFLAYCLMTTLRQQLRGHAVGLMLRVVLEKLATIQMLDVCVPTTDAANSS